MRICGIMKFICSSAGLLNIYKHGLLIRGRESCYRVLIQSRHRCISACPALLQGFSPTDVPHGISRRFRIISRKTFSSEADNKISMFSLVREDFLTVPNMLCVVRIIMAPVLSVLIVGAHYKVATVMVFITGGTDFIDGFIARTFPTQASRLGSFLDPLADKLLVATLFISLTVVDMLPIPLTILVVFRDLGLIAASAVLRYRTMPSSFTWSAYLNVKLSTVQITPPFISKLNTVFQLSLVMTSLVAASYEVPEHWIPRCICFATGGTTVISALWYIFLGKRFYRF